MTRDISSAYYRIMAWRCKHCKHWRAALTLRLLRHRPRNHIRSSMSLRKLTTALIYEKKKMFFIFIDISYTHY